MRATELLASGSTLAASGRHGGRRGEHLRGRDAGRVDLASPALLSALLVDSVVAVLGAAMSERAGELAGAPRQESVP